MKRGLVWAALCLALASGLVAVLWGGRIAGRVAMEIYRPGFEQVIERGASVQNYLKTLDAAVRAGDPELLQATAPENLRALPPCVETLHPADDLPDITLTNWAPDEDAPTCDPWKNLAAHWAAGSKVERSQKKLHDLNTLDEITCEPRVRLMYEGRDAQGAKRLDVIYGYLLFDFSGSLPVVRSAAVKRASSVVATGEPVFRDEAQEFGLNARRSRIPLREDLKFAVFPITGGGAAVGDVDGDGWEDVLMPGAAVGETRLFRNLGGRFEDVTEASGLVDPDELAMAAVMGDLDGDSDLDVVITHAYVAPSLFRNDGTGRFVREPLPRGQDTLIEGSASPTLADVDGDGDLDLYIAYHAPAAERVPETIFISVQGLQDRLYINDGTGHFSEEAVARGLAEARWTFQGSFADFDDDGDIDIYQVNDFGRNTLFVNDGTGHFTDSTLDWPGTEAFGFGMSASWGDYDTDGELDLYIAGLTSGVQWYAQDPAVLKYYGASLKAGEWISKDEMSAVMADIEPYSQRMLTKGRRIRKGPFQGNFLLRREADRFDDVSESTDTYFAQWGWAAGFVDFQNDGRPDLYATTGFITTHLDDDL